MEMAGEFRLATELPEAGNLDDLCYSYLSSPEERFSMRFVQIKHGLIPESKKITEKVLFDERG
jgi:hypothetical protein